MSNFVAIFCASLIMISCGSASIDSNAANGSISVAPKEVDSISKINNENYNVNSRAEVIDTLFFSDGSGNYELIVNGSKVKIIYQYLDYEKMDPELATLKNKKIIVPMNRIAYEGQSTADVFKIADNKLCVYNPESDGHDCYEFKRNKSTASLGSFFK